MFSLVALLMCMTLSGVVALPPFSNGPRAVAHVVPTLPSVPVPAAWGEHPPAKRDDAPPDDMVTDLAPTPTSPAPDVGDDATDDLTGNEGSEPLPASDELLPTSLSSLAGASPSNSTNQPTDEVMSLAARADPNACPPGVICLREVTVGIPGIKTANRTFDAGRPSPSHSCPRDALAALAQWRDMCGTVFRPKGCWTRAPSIERCCGEWVPQEDQRFWRESRVHNRMTDNSGNRGRRVLVPKPEKLDQRTSPWRLMRHIIKSSSDDYAYGDRDVCAKWLPRNDDVFTYYVQNFHEYDNIADVTSKGRVIDTGAYGAEEGGVIDTFDLNEEAPWQRALHGRLDFGGGRPYWLWDEGAP